MTQTLPPGFERLAPFAQIWALNTAAARARARTTSSHEQRVAFFEAAKQLVEPGLKLLDAKPLSQLDERERRLMQMLLSFTHVALAVETQGDDEPRHALNRDFLTITRAPADE